MASRGYPGKYPIDVPIHGLDQVKDATIFHAGTKEKNGDVVTAGGRVLSVCALGDTLDEARSRVYRACDSVQFEGKHFRRDIGKRREARKSRR
jgi:phosphoribosylamine--glycine ligase